MDAGGAPGGPGSGPARRAELGPNSGRAEASGLQLVRYCASPRMCSAILPDTGHLAALRDCLAALPRSPVRPVPAPPSPGAVRSCLLGLPTSEDLEQLGRRAAEARAQHA